MGKDGAHTWSLHHIVEPCGDRYRPGEIAVLAVPVVWERGRKFKLKKIKKKQKKAESSVNTRHD